MPAASDAPARSRPRSRVRIVHLGLGAFHRAHQAWYLERIQRAAPGDWGIEAYTGRGPAAATALAAQDGVYTLVTRAAEGDTFTTIESIVSAISGAEDEAWNARLGHPDTAIITLTVTEAGYRLAPGGGLDLADPEVAADLRLLGSGEPGAPVTAPGKLVRGLRARREAGAGPLAILSCDNLAGNGEVTRAVVTELAAAVDPALAAWITQNVSFISSMVDRITPATTAEDRATVLAETGHHDAMPVVTEPFSEWILAGVFPAGSPDWASVGVREVTDIDPYERRKLWLLNAAHSLLAYAGLPRGHHTVDEAFADPVLAGRVETLWAEAAEVLPLDAAEIAAATAALRTRFANPRIRHHLEQIARGGAHKLPPRVFDLMRARRAAGLEPAREAPRIALDWLAYLGRADTPGSEGDILSGTPTSEHLYRVLAPDLAPTATPT